MNSVRSSACDDTHRFVEAVSANALVTAILERAPCLDLRNWYLVAGCLFETVWNLQHGFEPTHGILDYDLFYFDDSDTSWHAEDLVIRKCARAFGDLSCRIEVRNQARVHLWYAQKFGVPCAAFRSCEEGIGSFLSASCCLGVRRVADSTAVYAPNGLADVFDLVVRPNPTRVGGGEALRKVYETKVRRWQQVWPRLKVLPWGANASANVSAGSGACSQNGEVSA